MENKVPKYLLQQLKTHSNSIITLPTLEELGGKDKLLSYLETKGFKCHMRESAHIEIKGEHSCQVYDHAVIEVIS